MSTTRGLSGLFMISLVAAAVGCGKKNQDPYNIDTSLAVEAVKAHVEANKERLHLQWIEKFPPGVKANPLENDGTWSHECVINVFSGPMAMPKSGKPARQIGHFVLKLRRDSGEWEITSGEVPLNIRLKRM